MVLKFELLKADDECNASNKYAKFMDEQPIRRLERRSGKAEYNKASFESLVAGYPVTVRKK